MAKKKSAQKKKKTPAQYAEACVSYILDSEASDFINYCQENGYHPKDGLNNIPHIYVDAIQATYKNKRDLAQRTAELEDEVWKDLHDESEEE